MLTERQQEFLETFRRADDLVAQWHPESARRRPAARPLPPWIGAALGATTAAAMLHHLARHLTGAWPGP